jgi:hypothetical protein
MSCCSAGSSNGPGRVWMLSLPQTLTAVRRHIPETCIPPVSYTHVHDNNQCLAQTSGCAELQCLLRSCHASWGWVVSRTRTSVLIDADIESFSQSLPVLHTTVT